MASPPGHDLTLPTTHHKPFAAAACSTLFGLNIEHRLAKTPAMCDFSEYRGSSDEWLAIEPTLQETATPRSVDEIISLRSAVNKGREEEASRAMETLGDLTATNDFSIPTRDGQQITARTYKALQSSEALLPIYVHLHGGGFLFGSLSSEDATCVRIALDAKVLVLNICYRHTPEHTYPTAWDDVEDALKWLGANVSAVGGDPQQVVLGGISAGAWLTASHLLSTTTQPSGLRIRGQVLMIPSLVYHECYAPQRAKLVSPDVSSYVQNKDAPILPAERLRLFSDLLGVSDPDEDDLRLNPGNASSAEVRHLPPTVFGIAGMDMLRDEALLYAMLLHDAGVPTQVSVFKGMPHGFRRFGKKLSECDRWDKVLVNGIRWTLSTPPVPSNFVIDS